MLIPVQDGQKVADRPIATPYSNQNFDTGLGAVAQGIDQLNAGREAVVDAQRRAAEKANAVGANDAVTAFQSSVTDDIHGKSGTADPAKLIDAADQGASAMSSPGFLSTQGKEAAATSADLRAGLDKRQQEIAASLPNDDQKQLFLKHSAPILLGAHATIEEHVTRQNQVAEQASVEGRQAVALRAIANNYADDAQVANLSAGAASVIRALSPEDGQAKLEAWNQKVAETRLNQYLSNKDWKGAEGLFATVKSQLGIQAPQFEKVIQTLKQDQQGETLAAQLVEQARDPENGRVDETKVNALVDSVPPGPMRDEVRGRLEHRMAVEGRAWTEKVNNVANTAVTDYLQNGNDIYAVTPSAKTWLITNAPEQWRKIEMMARADVEHSQNLPPTLAQQTAMNNFQLLARDHPDQVATMKADDFQTNWMSQFAVRDRERAGALLAQMHGQANKPEKLGPTQDRLLLQVGRDNGVFPPKQNDVSKWDDDDQARAYYAASQRLSEMIADEKRTTGKEPSLDKVQGWVNDMFLKGKDPNRGFLGFGGKTTRIESEVNQTDFQPSWTDKEQTQAKDALKKAGVPRVDDATVDAYLRRKHKLPSLPSKAKAVEAPTAAPVPAAPLAVPTVNDISSGD